MKHKRLHGCSKGRNLTIVCYEREWCTKKIWICWRKR